MSHTFDTIVIGLGGMGSATLYELAKRGVSVLGIEQFGVAHARGSSHGESRIIRRAYFEHPDYVPLLDHTYQMWRELELESGRELMNLCGLVLSGPADGEAVPGVLLANEKYGVGIETLTHSEAADRFPRIRFPDNHTIIAEADAGYLRVDDCVQTHCDQAVKHGATIRSGEQVQSWNATASGVTVKTDSGEYCAANVVIACGAWSSQVLSELKLTINVLRKSVFWFPDSRPSQPWPVFYIEDGSRSFYGLPGLDGASVKVAEHSGGDAVTEPTNVNREVKEPEQLAIAEFIQSTLDGVQSTPSSHGVCMYSMSADGHFIVDRHPDHENVVIMAGFSGHGFKFTPVMGAASADLVLNAESQLPVGFLRFR